MYIRDKAESNLEIYNYKPLPLKGLTPLTSMEQSLRKLYIQVKRGKAGKEEQRSLRRGEKRNKNSYSIPALCQISVNIGKNLKVLADTKLNNDEK